MGRKRYRSRANEELSNRLRMMGHLVSARRIERLVDEGLLDPPIKKSGSIGYPQGAEDLVIEVSLLQEKGLHFSEIAAVLFWRGREIPGAVLKTSYVSMFRKMLDALRRSSSSDDSFDIAEAAGTKLAARTSKSTTGREWRNRLNGRDESARSIYQSVNIVMLWSALLGRFPYEGQHREEALRELVDGSGLGAAEMDRMGHVGPLTNALPVAELGAVLDLFNLESLERVLESSTTHDLGRSRASVQSVFAFSRSMAEYIRRVGNLPDAMGFGPMASLGDDELTMATLIPWFLVLERNFPGLVDHQRVDELEGLTKINEARLLLLDAIPEKFWHLMVEEEDAIAGLPPETASELAEVLDGFSAAHPDEVALAMTERPDEQES